MFSDLKFEVRLILFLYLIASRGLQLQEPINGFVIYSDLKSGDRALKLLPIAIGIEKPLNRSYSFFTNFIL